jgi:hypothetical protein
MLWDHDIQTPGIAVSWHTGTGAGSSLTLSGAGFYGPQSQGDQTRIGVGQVIWRTGDPTRFSLETAAGVLVLRSLRLEALLRGREAESDPAELSGCDRDRASVQLPRGGPARPAAISRRRHPVLVSLDGVKNFGIRGSAEEDGEGEAFEGNVTVGRVGTPWNWRFFYTFQYVERDAILGAYNTDDWWLHSWYEGHRVGLAVTVLPNTFVQGSVVFQRRLDRPNYLNRILVDLVKMF